MKSKLQMFRTIAIVLTLGLGLSGCFTTTGQEMMDDPMTAPMETMEKGDMMEKETMHAPMDTMQKDTMGTGMSDPMK